MPNAVVDLLILDRRAHPDVLGHFGKAEQGREQLPEPRRPRGSFGQHLVDVAVGLEHCFEHLKDKRVGYVAVEKVRHRVDEHHTRLRPFLWMGESFRPKADSEGITTVLGRVYNGRAPEVDPVEALLG